MFSSQETRSEFFRPKLGFFSYLTSNSPPEPKIFKKKASSSYKPLKFNLSVTNNSSVSYLPNSIYQDPKYPFTRTEVSNTQLPNPKKVFKPPGPLSQSFSFPYMPTIYKEQPPKKPSKRNILVPARNGIFSQHEYISPSPIPKPVDLVKVKKVSKKKPFLAMTNPKPVFSFYPHNIENQKNEEKSEESKIEESEINKTQKEEPQETLLVFRAGTRSTSQLFARYKYEPDINFPAKKKNRQLPNIHDRPFIPVSEMQTGASPSIMNSSWILKKENKFF